MITSSPAKLISDISYSAMYYCNQREVVSKLYLYQNAVSKFFKFFCLAYRSIFDRFVSWHCCGSVSENMDFEQI